MTKRFKKLCTAVCILLIASFAFSSLFIIAEADHDCVGEGCHVCQAVRVCLNAVGSISLLLVGIVSTPFLKSVVLFCSYRKYGAVNTNNLINLKVKLSI